MNSAVSRLTKAAGSMVGSVCLVAVLASLASLAVAGTPVVVSTYESLGIYWDPPEGDSDVVCSVEYRSFENGVWSDWKQGLDLWFDGRHGNYEPPVERQDEYRGSIVGLKPGTVYNVRLTLDNEVGTTAVVSRIRTWYDDAPVGHTTQLEPSDFEEGGVTVGYVIDQGGVPLGYERYEPAWPFTVDVTDAEGNSEVDSYCLRIEASNVVVHGFTFRGGQNTIEIAAGMTNIVIEDCDIFGWGTNAEQHIDEPVDCIDVNWGYECSAIRTGYNPLHDIERITIQRNRIHDPRWDSNTWCEFNVCLDEYGDQEEVDYDPYHPWGPIGIKISNPGGNIVIRYNEIFSDNGNLLLDGIASHSNFSHWGGPGSDSDIYQNWISDVADDAIEMEGGNANTRVWGNYITNTRVIFGVQTVSLGPLYIWRNIGDKSSICPTVTETIGGTFLKCGNRWFPGETETTYWGDGRTYVFNNTLFQDTGLTGAQGVGDGISSGSLSNYVTRNNIIHIRDWWDWDDIGIRYPFDDDPRFLPNDMDFDMTNGRVVYEQNGSWYDDLNAQPNGYFDPTGPDYTPVYAGVSRPIRDPSIPGNFQLDPTTAEPGHDDGDFIPNFTSGFEGVAPDLGAHEYGTADMSFGVSATSPAPPATTTMIFRDGWWGYEGHADARISNMKGKETTRYGDDINAYVRNPHDLGWGYRYQMVSKFDVGSIPTGATVLAATFDIALRSDTIDQMSTVNVHVVSDEWVESEVCFAYASGTTSWDIVDDMNAASLTSHQQDATMVENQFLRFDLTSLVQDWIDGTADPDAGFVLVETDNVFHEFHTKEAYDRNVRPRLVVVFDETRAAKTANVTEKAPALASLQSVAPNPFNPATEIKFHVGGDRASADVNLSVFDLKGRKVANLIDTTMPAGDHSVVWEGRSDDGRQLESGVYFAKLSVSGHSFTRKLTLVK